MDFDYFEGRPDDIRLEHMRRVNLQIHERFHVRDNNNPLNLSVPEFIRLYRMPQHEAIHLCNILRPYVPQRRSPQQVSLFRKLLCALSFLASGSYQRIIGRTIDCSVSQTSVSRFVKEICMALTHDDVLNQFIRFPLTHAERVALMTRNEDVLGMPRTIGYLDGFLTRLSYLPRDEERQAYFGRKGWLALNNQMICDADLNILNIDARWPGSLRDSHIWDVSSARPVMEQAYWADRCWLLGDSGYYSAPWLHVPILHAARGTPEYNYTQLHCHCRNVVERCIGCLKARWRILSVDRCIHYKDAAYAGRIVVSCCVLHNFCNQQRIPLPQPLIEFDEGAPPDPPNDLPIPLRQRAQEEMQFLIDFAHQRRLDRDNVVQALYL